MVHIQQVIHECTAKNADRPDDGISLEWCFINKWAKGKNIMSQNMSLNLKNIYPHRS